MLEHEHELQVMDIAANAPPVEIARWRSDELGERPSEAESEQAGDSGALGTSASKQSLFAAAGLDGGGGNGGVRGPRTGCSTVLDTLNTFDTFALLNCSSAISRCMQRLARHEDRTDLAAKKGHIIISHYLFLAPTSSWETVQTTT